MATDLTEIEEAVEKPAPVAPADNLPDWLKLTRRGAISVALVSFVFWFLACLPLWHTDIWLHLKYGEWIWSHGQLPQTALFMPLAEGVRYVDYAWLSQLAFYGIYRAAGLDGLALLYAATVTGTIGFVLAAAFRSTGRLWLSVLLVGVLVPLLWPNLMPFRPQMFGTVLFTGLLYLVLARPWHATNWVIVPVGFALWVNLHSSFAVGLGVLACAVVGRAIDAWRDTRRFGSIFSDADTRRWFLVSEMALVACLANPYGLDLFREVLTFSRCPNLRDVIEWQPLSVRAWDGIGFAASVVALVVLMRFSRRRVAASEALLLLGIGVACLPCTRLTQWWSLLIPYAVLPHVGEVLDRLWSLRLARRVRNFRYTVLAAAACWLLIAFSPPFFALMHHQPRKLSAQLTRFTPVETAEYLRDHPPHGPVFNPYDWGDWLTWSGPDKLNCIVNSHIHLIPSEIWNAYVRVRDVRAGWEMTLEGLGIHTLVIDKDNQKALLNEVRASDTWRIVHEDKLGVIAELVTVEKPAQSDQVAEPQPVASM